MDSGREFGAHIAEVVRMGNDIEFALTSVHIDNSFSQKYLNICHLTVISNYNSMIPDIGLIATIAVALITFFTKIVPEFKDFTFIKKKRRLYNLKNELSGDLIKSTPLKNAVQQEYEVICFYYLTGISTNYSSIDSYLKLYNSLGRDHTWKDIKHIKSFLTFDDENNLKINIKEFQLLPSKFFFALGLIILILSITALLFNNLFEFGTLVKVTENMTLHLYLNIILPIMALTAYFFIFLNYKPIKAEKMDKYLQKNRNMYT